MPVSLGCETWATFRSARRQLRPCGAPLDRPFNAHLATDAGGGFLATGVVLVLAAAWGERRVAQLALGGVLTFALAHLSYHALSPAPGLTESENVISVIALVLAAAIPVALLVATRRAGKDAR